MGPPQELSPLTAILFHVSRLAFVIGLGVTPVTAALVVAHVQGYDVSNRYVHVALGVWFVDAAVCAGCLLLKRYAARKRGL